jgi:hypothetical protein
MNSDEYLSLCSRDHFFRRLCKCPSESRNLIERSVAMIAILDGSDLFAHAHGLERAGEKEEVHRTVCHVEVAAGAGTIVEPTDGDWEDEYLFRDATLAVFAGDFALPRAIATAMSVHRHLDFWNLEHETNWIEQVHSRIAISSISWLNALLLVSQAQCRDTILEPHDFSLLTASEQILLAPRLGARPGVPFEVQFELEQELDQEVADFAFDADLAQRLLQRTGTRYRVTNAAQSDVRDVVATYRKDK